MSFLIASSPCLVCTKPFSFNTERVPSLIVQGVKRPICRGCVPLINKELKRAGRELIVPLPGAYGAWEVA